MASGWLFSIIFCPAFMMVAPAGLARAEGATRHVNVDSGGYAIGRYDPVA